MARSATAAMMRGVGVAGRRGRVAARLSLFPGCVVGGKTLDNAIARHHTAIDAEVATHHERTHGRILASQFVGLVRQICLVLAPIDQHQARIPRRFPVALVGGLGPPTPLAEACEVTCISHVFSRV